MPVSQWLALSPALLLPVESSLLLALAAGLGLVAALGPAEPAPPEEVTTAAVFAFHGHV